MKGPCKTEFVKTSTQTNQITPKETLKMSSSKEHRPSKCKNNARSTNATRKLTYRSAQQNENSVNEEETEVNVVTSLNRNTVFLDINGKKIQALVDSGASVSCLQKSTFDRINKDNSLKVQISTIRNIVGVGGERHAVFGQVELTLNISGLKVDQKFIVIDQLHHPLILGLDFMQTYQVNIDFHHKLMTIGNDAIIVALACDSKHGYARCIKSEVIPPGKKKLLFQLNYLAVTKMKLYF